MGDSVDYTAETIAAILAASDVVRREWTEPITEPVGLANGMSRITREEWTSAIIGKTYRRIYRYINSADSSAWGAISNFSEEVI